MTDIVAGRIRSNGGADPDFRVAIVKQFVGRRDWKPNGRERNQNQRR